LQSFVTGTGRHKQEIMLQNIVRTESDPSLFQIPAGYTRVEREPAVMTPGPLVPLPAPAANPQ
jgi:hypothetical protein